MNFKHPDFEFKLVEYPNMDGVPSSERLDRQHEDSLVKEGWIRLFNTGDSKGTVTLYRRKKNVGA